MGYSFFIGIANAHPKRPYYAVSEGMYIKNSGQNESLQLTKIAAQEYEKRGGTNTLFDQRSSAYYSLEWKSQEGYHVVQGLTYYGKDSYGRLVETNNYKGTLVEALSSGYSNAWVEFEWRSATEIWISIGNQSLDIGGLFSLQK